MLGVTSILYEAGRLIVLIFGAFIGTRYFAQFCPLVCRIVLGEFLWLAQIMQANFWFTVSAIVPLNKNKRGHPESGKL